ncbi:MAG: protein kinase [Candidatus Zixiibacteriota bacterium]
MDSDQPITGLRAGLSFSHYSVRRKLGAGGMGEVWLAEDASLQRRVALKFLSPQLTSDPDCHAKLKREAQAAAALNHPNIITIYEVGEFQGRSFIAMEYVDGESLKDRMATGRLAIPEVIQMTKQIARGLGRAHAVGTVHRDIKPHNILLTKDGTAKILDFGLAQLCSGSDVTRTSATVGTMAYMSPEQAKAQEVTPASDLFALGVVMYEMLTGVLPFRGEYEAAVLYAIVHQEPEPLQKLRPDIPPALEQLVMRLLEKDPSKRLQSADDLLAQLQAISVSGHAQASHIESSTRHRRLLVSSGIAVLALVVAITGWHVYKPHVSAKGAGAPMLAVLPFDNLGLPGDEYFADGMTDAVTMQLAKAGRMGVVSRASSMQYKGSKLRVAEIGSELGVDYAITGAVNWERTVTPSRVRISAALVKVADDTYLWADSYERPLEHIFELQAEIAQRVAAALNVAVGSPAEQQGGGLTPNLQAYDFYLRGNQYFNRSWDKDDIQIALRMYRQAVALDSGFASAYAMLCRAEESMYWEYYDRSDATRRRARQAVDRALTLQPDLLEGHLALGYYYYHCELDYENALREFDRALTLQPTHAELLNAVGAVQRRQGKLDAAAQNFMKALEYDPRSYLKAFDVALTFAMMREFREANRFLDRTIALAPDWPLPHVVRAWMAVLRDGDAGESRRVLAQVPAQVDLARSPYYWWLMRILESDFSKVLSQTRLGTDTAGFYLHRAQMYRLLGRGQQEYAYADSARCILETKVRALPEDARFNSQLGLAYAGMRRKSEAIAYARKGVELLPTSRDAYDALFLMVNLAETLMIFDEYDAAVEQLGALLSVPGFVSVPYLKADPLWKPLHDHPAFRKLLAGAA